jgi:hypothetical protein
MILRMTTISANYVFRNIYLLYISLAPCFVGRYFLLIQFNYLRICLHFQHDFDHRQENILLAVAFLV